MDSNLTRIVSKTGASPENTGEQVPRVSPFSLVSPGFFESTTKGYFTLDADLKFASIHICGNSDLQAQSKELIGRGLFEARVSGEVSQLKADLRANLDALHILQQELTRCYDATISGWSRAIDLRDEETEGHSQRVTEMTVRLGEVLGLDSTLLVHMRRGALLHDVGKLGIPDAILLKSGPLTDDEWAIMRQHPAYAYEMLHPIEFLRPALDIPYCHHERWDGTGYPNELRGEQIPFAARIFAVADVYDALRSNRPYREAWPAEEVHRYIDSMSGRHFDPTVVDAFRILTQQVP